MLRLYVPTSGSITIAKTNVLKVHSNELLEKIKIVPQDNELINTSIFENLSIVSREKISKNQAYHALQQAAALEFVKRLPQGIDTLVGPEGVKLSGGEKQRICLARALLTKPEILVLDEATSNLDVITERKVYEELQKLPKAITIIAITHRISSMYLFDRVMVMHQGKIVGEGTHEELMRNNSYYQLLWKSTKHVN